MKFTIDVPGDFSLWHTVYSHGWCSLQPFSVDTEKKIFGMCLDAGNGRITRINLTESKSKYIEIEIPPNGRLTAQNKKNIERTVRSCLRLDEDYSTFYAEVKRYKQFAWAKKIGAGRLLRTPSVFEDVVKMICTTNCSWGLTQAMVNNFCSKLGTKIDNGANSFPLPEGIAGCTEKYIRKEIRAGYRSPYILELSKRVARKEIDLESWRSSELPSKELFEEVRSVKGMGPYAAANILKLVGRYDYLGIDSWCRKQFCEIHTKKKASDRSIEKYYEPFGKWKGLFFWLELTKPWYDKKFPL
ncbi:MAG: DNA-3-methyladenine glycosylase family protein [Bacteroidota bacterium]